MIDAIRSEFRKLLTVRSTYFIVLISLAIVAFFAGFIQGIRVDATSLHQADYLVHESTSATLFVGLILAFAGLLLVGHEYRYNTIMYTLTSTNRRLKVLFAKVIVISVFALVTALLVTFFSPLCTIIGMHFSAPIRHGLTLAPQTFDYWNVIWRCLLCGWGYALYAFILIAILRSQVGAIVTFLIVPLIGENILTVLVKENAKYLPFTALQSIAEPTLLKGSTSTQGAKIAAIYVVVGLVVSSILFVRRDAN